jgi:hypothetical protein
MLCGGRGIRTPGDLRLNGFQDRRIRPLCHPSVYASSSAAAPDTISEISVVIALCRA